MMRLALFAIRRKKSGRQANGYRIQPKESGMSAQYAERDASAESMKFSTVRKEKPNITIRFVLIAAQNSIRGKNEV